MGKHSARHRQEYQSTSPEQPSYTRKVGATALVFLALLTASQTDRLVKKIHPDQQYDPDRVIQKIDDTLNDTPTPYPR